MAHQKLTLQMTHQKDARKLMDKINYAKNEREQENQIWIKKYDTMAQLYDEKLKKAKEDYLREIDALKEIMAKKEHAKCEQI